MKIIEILKQDSLYPSRLRKIEHPPRKLYAVGNIQLLSKQSSVAIVGARKSSLYGQRQAFHFAKELAKVGITIVSGMALGIDSVAHLASINQRGSTIAVLGSGFYHIFPEENEYLFYRIIQKGGCVISEYPPEEPPDSTHFPRRNRIVSGLASCVLVVEAAKKSGSLITANIAKKQGKEVFVVPSNLGRKHGEGTNELIRIGATMVTSANQIMDKIEVEKTKEEVSSQKEIPKEYESIYQVLKEQESYTNEISKKVKIPLAELTATLTMMELEGYIEKNVQNQYRIRR